VTSLSLGLGVGGTAGLVYVGSVAAALRGLRALYVPVGEDWAWNAFLPALVYATLPGNGGFVPARGAIQFIRRRHGFGRPSLYRNPQRVGRRGLEQHQTPKRL
jgi:hypothetical protein